MEIDNMTPANCKVLFVSEDGERFRLFVDGHEICITRGVTIKAGENQMVEVTPTMVAAEGYETIKLVSPPPKNLNV
jgi:hypothetical protein